MGIQFSYVLWDSWTSVSPLESKMLMAHLCGPSAFWFLVLVKKTEIRAMSQTDFLASIFPVRDFLRQMDDFM